MVKDKKNISDFRQALLSQSKYIAAETKEPEAPKKNLEKKAKASAFTVELQPDIYREIEKLAGTYKLGTTEFANLALEHLLKIDYVRKP
jgi:hypothetical protein